MSQRRVLLTKTIAYVSVNQNKNDFSICLEVPSVTAGSRSAATMVRSAGILAYSWLKALAVNRASHLADTGRMLA